MQPYTKTIGTQFYKTLPKRALFLVQVNFTETDSLEFRRAVTSLPTIRITPHALYLMTSKKQLCGQIILTDYFSSRLFIRLFVLTNSPLCFLTDQYALLVSRCYALIFLGFQLYSIRYDDDITFSLLSKTSALTAMK